MLQVAGQGADVDSVRRVERDWLVAELRGDTARINCLLEPDYAEISFDAMLHHKADILAHAAARKGSNDPIPTIELTIIVHGTSATAYSVQSKHDLKGEAVKLYFADSFVFRDGGWHPYFSTNSVAAPRPKLKD
jgi:hypothetical protein